MPTFIHRMVKQSELRRRRDDTIKCFTEKKHECLASSSSFNVKLLDAKVSTLVESILKGNDVTSYDVTTHLIKMAHEIGRKECNALTAEMYDDAILSAQLIDQGIRQGKYNNKGTPPPLLCGVPISIKVSLHHHSPLLLLLLHWTLCLHLPYYT